MDDLIHLVYKLKGQKAQRRLIAPEAFTEVFADVLEHSVPDH